MDQNNAGSTDEGLWYAYETYDYGTTQVVINPKDNFADGTVYVEVYEEVSPCHVAFIGRSITTHTFLHEPLRSYKIRVYVDKIHTYIGQEWGYFDISMNCVSELPPNDECATAKCIRVNPSDTCNYYISGTLSDASGSNIQDMTCAGNENNDVWFTFVSTSNHHQITLSDITGNSSPVYWSVWSGDCRALVNEFCAGAIPSVTLSTVVGNIYYIRVYSSESTSENAAFHLCVSTPQVPPDPCTESIIRISNQLVLDGTYHALDQVKTVEMVTVPADGIVNFFAENNVELNVQFEVQLGANFEADIVPCTGEKSNYSSNKDETSAGGKQSFNRGVKGIQVKN